MKKVAKESETQLISYGLVNVRGHVNKFLFEKFLSKIEKIIKIFLLFNKFFIKNISKIHKLYIIRNLSFINFKGSFGKCVFSF